VKVGSRTGNVFNVLDCEIKNAISEVSIDQNEDSHPDLSPEDR